MSNAQAPMPDAQQLVREQAMVDLVDEQGNSIGQDTVAAAHTAPGALHRAFSVMLFDDQHRVLVQQRALSKTRFPGIWGPSCCGHPVTGGDLESQVARRVQEELGVTAADLQVIGHTTYFITAHGDRVEREYDHVLIGRCRDEPDPNPSEVAATRWFTVPDLTQDLAAHHDRYGQWLPPVLKVLAAWHETNQQTP